MAIILTFPGHQDTAPMAGSREARRANSSAVTPAARAVGVRKMGSHHSAGMLSRWGHLRAAATEAPISSASASGDSQSAMTSRNVEIERIESFLGQLVLKRKVTLSHDLLDVDGQDVPMAPQPEDPAISAYRDAFAARVKQAREARNLTQKELSEILEIDQGTYKQYETRSFLPHYLIRRFCLVCGIEPGWLFDMDVSAAVKRQVRHRRRGPPKRRKPTAA